MVHATISFYVHWEEDDHYARLFNRPFDGIDGAPWLFAVARLAERDAQGRVVVATGDKSVNVKLTVKQIEVLILCHSTLSTSIAVPLADVLLYHQNGFVAKAYVRSASELSL